MAGNFSERMDELIAQTPEHVTGTVVVDQVYAQYQHEGMDLKHPRGGRAKYLGGPLIENYVSYYQRLADALLDGDTTKAMIHNMEDLSTEGVYKNAPWEFADLKASGHPIVEENGATVYDRAPMVHRLSEQELKDKGDLRRMGLGG